MSTASSSELLGISSETWAIVAATFLGPVFAILVARWRDQVKEVRTRRMFIFRTLLATRRQNITTEHVTALNLVEIDFYDVPEIQSAWRAYHQHLNSAPAGRPMTPPENEAFVRSGNDHLAKLIFAIAKFLGFSMSELDIRNGGYAPDGWRYRDERVGIVQEFMKEIALGRRSFPIAPTSAPPFAPPPPPPPPPPLPPQCG